MAVNLTKKLSYIIIGLFLLVLIGAQMGNSPAKTPSELVGSYERIENRPMVKMIDKLIFSESGDVEFRGRAIFYDPPVSTGGVWKGHIQKIEVEKKTVRVNVKIATSDISEFTGRTMVFTYDHPGNQSLSGINALGFQDMPNEVTKWYGNVGVSVPPPQPQTSALQDSPAAAPQKILPVNMAGKYALQTQTGSGEITIESGAGGAYGVSIIATNDSGCVAEVQQAIGVIKDNGTLWATKLDEDGKTQCALEIKFDQQSASVSENGCTGFHGVACGFTGTYTKRSP